MDNRTLRLFAVSAVLAVTVGLGAGASFAFAPRDGDPFADCRSGTVAGGAATIGGPFTLVNGEGQPVTDRDVLTDPTLVYFGYTFCPDICPTDLARNALVADDLAARGIKVGQVFVTIDPARDTPDVVRDFAAAVADRALILEKGTVRWQGGIAALEADEDVRRAYLTV